MSVIDWLDAHSDAKYLWFIKRLAANDTKASGGNQAGPHISKSFLFHVFPEINRVDLKNPDHHFQMNIDSHGDSRTVRAVYYNNKFHENQASGRNETRVTGFGGISSALLDPDNTGAIAVFAFDVIGTDGQITCDTWVCRDIPEEDSVEDHVGPVEPGRAVVWPSAQLSLLVPTPTTSPCWLSANDIPSEWLADFPPGVELAQRAIALRPALSLSADKRLIIRKDCEYEIFRSVEEAVELPGITSGFSDIQSFVDRANSILNRRKSRAGRSLELHTRQIFIEEQLVENVNFSYQPESEPNKSPDFLFPSEAAYKDDQFPREKLRMLAVKTSCKDRWRQIVKEADRIPTKHLLTVQEGVSVNQFNEMTTSGVQLVVPAELVKSYPESVRPNLQTLEAFIGEVKSLTD